MPVVAPVSPPAPPVPEPLPVVSLPPAPVEPLPVLPVDVVAPGVPVVLPLVVVPEDPADVAFPLVSPLPPALQYTLPRARKPRSAVRGCKSLVMGRFPSRGMASPRREEPRWGGFRWVSSEVR